MSNSAPLKLAQVRDLGQVIGATFTLLRQHWRTLLRALAFTALPVALVAGVMMGYFAGGLQRSMLGADPDAVLGIMAGLVGPLGLGYLALIAAYMIAIAVSYEFLRAYHLGELHLMQPGDLWKRARGQVFNYLGLAFLVGLVSVLGFLLCVIPGIWLGIGLCLSFSVLAFERVGGTNAMRRSWELVKEHWWETFGIVIIMGLIQWVVTSAIVLPFTVLSFIWGFSSGMGDMSQGLPEWYGWVMGVSSAVQYGVTILLYPLSVTAISMQYFSLVERKESRSLEQRLEGFDAV